MKAVITIITALTIAGHCLAADLQSSPSKQDDELLLNKYFEQTQNELETQHLDAVKESVQNEIDSLFFRKDFNSISRSNLSIADKSINNLQFPDESVKIDKIQESTDTLG
jgi:hypothetical protein